MRGGEPGRELLLDRGRLALEEVAPGGVAGLDAQEAGAFLQPKSRLLARPPFAVDLRPRRLVGVVDDGLLPVALAHRDLQRPQAGGVTRVESEGRALSDDIERSGQRDGGAGGHQHAAGHVQQGHHRGDQDHQQDHRERGQARPCASTAPVGRHRLACRLEQIHEVAGRVVEMHARLMREAFQAAPHHAPREVDGGGRAPRRELDAHGGAAGQVLADAQAAPARGKIDQRRRMPARGDAVARAQETGAPRRAPAIDSVVRGAFQREDEV